MLRRNILFKNRQNSDFFKKYNSGNINPQEHATNYTYDAMGNILTQKRNGGGGLNQDLDDLTYNYHTDANGNLINNRLYLVNDNVNSSNYGDDIDNQGSFNNTKATINTANNYGYDELGNLIRDNQEEIANIETTNGSSRMQKKYAEHQKTL